jgi:hypothetical protein
MSNSKISTLTSATTPLAGTETLPIVQSSATKQVSVANLTAGRAVAMGSGSSAGNGSTYSNFTFNSSSAGGFDLNMQTAGSGRWVVSKTATAEDFFIYRYNDSGGYAGNPLQISRSNGNVRLENNLVIGTSGNGIDFSATPGTGTSELFADYEEGTWTPTLTADVNFTSVTYNALTQGTYTKVGRIVTFYCTMFTSSITKGAASGTVYISGLPFTSAASTPSGGGLITACQLWSVNYPLYAEVAQGDTKMALGKRALVNGTTSAIDVTDVGTGASNFARIVGSYQV